MADETISTRIVANADFSALIADVHKVTASLSRLQEQLANSNKMLANQVAVMNRSFSDTIRSTGQFSSHFVSLTSDVEKFGKNLDGGRLKLRNYFDTFQGHVKTSGGLIRELARQQVAMQNAILQPLGRNAQGLMQFNVHVPRGLDEIKNKTAIAKQELQIMNRVIQDGAVQLINWGKNTQWAGRQLTVGLTLPLAAFGKAAADAFRTADQELTRLTKVYGDVAGTSAAELGKVRKEVSATAQQLATTMGVNFQETIALAADIAATGKTGNELLSSVSETTRLAVLGEVDRQEAMKATLAIQSAFKSNTDELAQSINFLNAVENQTSTTLNDLVEAIPKAGPVIKGLGGSVQDLALYLTAMREGGVSASEGANALKSALASLINPTDVAVAKFQGFGIDLLSIVNDNAGDVTKTLFSLQAALDRLDPLQKQQAIEQLFGKFQFSRLNALFENLGRQGSQTLQVLDLMKASAGDLESVASRELAAVTESAAGKYRRAVEGLKAELATVGEEFLKINTVVVQGISKVLEFINNLPRPIKQVLTFLGGLTAVAGPLIMLTGVLANFFGYILKGAMHMKSFFKGGEGWKYLTPEMLAAEKAGRLVEQSFYSDAKAAAILQTALRNLIDEFSLLEAKAKSGAVAVNPAVSTMAGNLVMGAGVRVVDPNNPLAGAMGTRASTHMVPRSGMSEQQRMAQTIFGLVPGAIPVNRKIGDAPQIYMNEPLPPVPGVTTVGGVSTGVVASEAARWHSMMATLAMQSKAEIEALKKQIAATGVVSKDFMMQFDDILPIVSRLTDNAAKESSLIVAELRAGKMTVEQARARIIALNLEVERMITQAVTTQAASMGRTLNPTVVPTLDQPVVDPTGKSNMRELFKKSKTRDLIDKVARSLGVRTSGAGYNIETTRPKKFNRGGAVYLNNGNIVPGPNVNRDVVPAMLTPGEFVVNREATQRNLPLLQAINSGSFGGQVSQGRGNYGPTFSSGYASGEVEKLYDYLDYLTSASYEDTFRQNAILSDAIALVDRKGMPVDKAIDFATQIFDGAMQNSKGDPDEYFRQRDLISKRIGMSTGIVGAVQPAASDELREQVAEAMKGRGYKRLYPHADRAHLFPRSYSETSKGYFGQTVHDPYNRFSNTITQRLPEIPDRVPISSATAFGRADLIARSMGFEDHNDMLLRRADVEEIAKTGKAPKGRPAPIGIFRFLRTEIPGTAIRLASRGRMGRAVNKNRGGMIYMNSGGMVPGVKYLNEGSEQPVRSTGGMGMFMGGMGLSMAGSAIGGTAGSAMTNIGMAMQFMPMLSMFPKMSNGAKGFMSVLKGLGNTAANTISRLKGFAVANPMLLASTAAVAGLIAGFRAWRREVEETKRENIMLSGITKQGAEEAKVKYFDLGESIKLANEQLKLSKERGLAAYAAYTSSGVPGLTLTIKQLRELKKEVKETMPETLATFNSIDGSKVVDLAKNLKAQYVAGGMSIQDATNKIYALIEASNKAGMGLQAISDKGFAAIKDKATAAEATLRTFKGMMDKITNVDGAAFASGIDSTIGALESAVQSLIGTKNASGQTITEAEAIAMAYQKITNSGAKNIEIGRKGLEILQKHKPELAAIINSGDTIASIYAKWKLALAGVAVDLKTLTAEQAQGMAIYQDALGMAADAAETNTATGAALENSAKATNKLKTEIKDAQKVSKSASKGEAGLSKDRIRAIQDEIKAIRKRAEEKKKALQDSLNAENTELELQKLQLEYQQALARGDRDAAAQAQIQIQQLSKQYQTQKAIDKIEENARKEEEKRQAILDADARAKEKQQAAAAGAGDTITRKTETLNKINEISNKLTDLAVRQANINLMPQGREKDTLQEALTGERKTLMDELTKSSDAVQQAFKQFIDPKTNKLLSDIPLLGGMGGGAGGAFNTLVAEVTAGAKANFEYLATKLGNGISLKDIHTLMGGGKGTAAKDTPTIGVGAGARSGRPMPGDTSPEQAYGKRVAPGMVTTIMGNKVIYDENLVPVNIKNNPQEAQRLSKKFNVKLARGGRIVPGVPYTLNDGGHVEGITFDVPAKVFPNINTMPKYNIPTNTISGINNVNNKSSSNSIYNIDINLSGTNVTADDIMRKFKAELALINAKEGRTRTLGGNY